jgi:hypothetical protein
MRERGGSAASSPGARVDLVFLDPLTGEGVGTGARRPTRGMGLGEANRPNAEVKLNWLGLGRVNAERKDEPNGPSPLRTSRSNPWDTK